MPDGLRRVPWPKRPDPARARRRGRTARGCVLRRSPAGGVRVDRRRQRSPAGGLFPLRSHDSSRATGQRDPLLSPAGAQPAEPRGALPSLRDTGDPRAGPRHRASRWSSGAGHASFVPATWSSAAGRSTRRSCSSFRAWGTSASSRRSGFVPCTICRVSARTCRITSRCTSSMPPRCRCRCSRRSRSETGRASASSGWPSDPAPPRRIISSRAALYAATTPFPTRT